MEEIKQFLKRYNFRPNDLLGQNFLIDDFALENIVKAADIQEGDEILEIGPGIGNLTKELAEELRQKNGFLLAVEKDDRYFPILKDQLGDKLESHTKTPKSKSNVKLVFADALRFNFQELLKPGYKVVANIPYYITGQIIEMLVTAKKRPSKIVLLVQKEVAERIIAPKGELSILAISVQLYADPKIIAQVPKESFYPQPKVDSAVLELNILPTPRIDVDEKEFFRIVKACFSGKRKQIHNTLKNNLKVPPENLEQIFKNTGIDAKARPQELSIEQWAKLYTEIFVKASK